MPNEPIMHRVPGTEEIALSPEVVTVLEETDKGARVRGVALVDEVISQRGHGRYYSRGFNDRCMAATNSFMEQGGTVTVYSRHGKAIPPSGQLSTNLPIGRVTKPLWRDGKEVWYEAFIAPTSEGKDVLILLQTEVMRASSIRASTYRSRMRKIEDREVEEMIDAVIVGIDLADEAGIAGAGVREVLEEAPVWSDEFIEENQAQEGTDMDWKTIDLKGLLENRRDLLDEYAASLKEVLPTQDPALAAKTEELQSQVTTLTASQEELTAKLDAATEQLAQWELKLKIAQAATFGVSRLVAEELAKVVKTEADIEAHLATVKATAIAQLLGTKPDDRATAKGITRVTEEAEPSETNRIDDASLTDDQQTVLSLAR